MRISYRQDDIPMQKRNLFIADLIGYKLQRDLEATKKIQALSGDRRFLSSIINVAKKHGGSMGITVDTVTQGLQTALDTDIFSFKINNVDFFKMAQEKIKENKFELEIFMNPLYFSSEIAMKLAVMPMFRRKRVDEAFIDERMDKSKRAWMYNFERKTKEYLNPKNYTKKIIEE